MQGLELKIYQSELPFCWSLTGGKDLDPLRPLVVDGLWGPGDPRQPPPATSATCWPRCATQILPFTIGASQVARVVKNLPANSGDVRDTGSISASERSAGGGNGNPLQYSCPENPTDRGAWRATVHRIAQSRTRLKRLSTHTSSTTCAMRACSRGSGLDHRGR